MPNNVVDGVKHAETNTAPNQPAFSISPLPRGDHFHLWKETETSHLISDMVPM